MKRLVLELGWAVFLVVFAGAVVAAEPNVEASMVVFGTIKVSPDGSVNGYTLSRQSDLPPAVLQVVEKRSRTGNSPDGPCGEGGCAAGESWCDAEGL